MIIFLLAGLMLVDLLTGAVIHLVVCKDFTSAKMKDGCLKKAAILMIGVGAYLVGQYYPEFAYLDLVVTPFVVSEIVSLKESADLLMKRGDEK